MISMPSTLVPASVTAIGGLLRSGDFAEQLAATSLGACLTGSAPTLDRWVYMKVNGALSAGWEAGVGAD